MINGIDVNFECVVIDNGMFVLTAYEGEDVDPIGVHRASSFEQVVSIMEQVYDTQFNKDIVAGFEIESESDVNYF